MKEDNNLNSSIGCSVSECKYHLENDYCSLDHIHVTTSNLTNNVDTPEYTECGSYEKKNQ